MSEEIQKVLITNSRIGVENRVADSLIEVLILVFFLIISVDSINKRLDRIADALEVRSIAESVEEVEKKLDLIEDRLETPDNLDD